MGGDAPRNIIGGHTPEHSFLGKGRCFRRMAALVFSLCQISSSVCVRRMVEVLSHRAAAFGAYAER